MTEPVCTSYSTGAKFKSKKWTQDEVEARQLLMEAVFAEKYGPRKEWKKTHLNHRDSRTLGRAFLISPGYLDKLKFSDNVIAFYVVNLLTKTATLVGWLTMPQLKERWYETGNYRYPFAVDWDDLESAETFEPKR